VARRRFIQMREPPYDLIEVSADYEPEPHRADGLLYNDRSYDGLRATDGTDISSRSKHREYMKRNGLTTMDDFKGVWDKARQERDQFYTKGGPGIKQDIVRTIEYLQKNRK
jgi:hypothetical protein